MLTPENYIFAVYVFIRFLGLIYFFAFFPFIFQIRGLIGERGILPVKAYLQRAALMFRKRRYYYLPSLFWLNCSDTALVAVPIVGSALSICLMMGVYPAILLPILMILYLSIITVGQDFLSFGWELFLMEITANAIVLSWTDTPNLFAWISINLLVARFHFQSGAVKLQSGDANWHNLTALAYHYQTQPIANTQAWFFHKLPLWFHKLSCAFMFVVEIVFPIFVFFGEDLRMVAYLSFVGLQVLIWFTGNFSYLNYMTVCLCTILVSDHYFSSSPVAADSSFVVSSLASLFGLALIGLQLMRCWLHFFPSTFCSHTLRWISPFFIANRYGIFAVMTTKRYEIVVEGSEDGENWKEYTFYHKASEVNRRPRRISPYQPRIDWQAWFLPFSGYHRERWFQNFLSSLIEGSPEVLKLLRHNPFPEEPPKYVRALIYDYVFSDFKTLKEKGEWWSRTLVGNYSPVLMKRDSQ